MSWWQRFSVWMLVLMALVCPRLASANSPLGLETRVGVFAFVVPTLIGVQSLGTTEKHQGNSFEYDENAPGYRLAAESVAEGTAQVAPKLSQTVENHLADVVTRGPFKGELSRPYTGSPLTIQEILSAGQPTPDTFIPGGLRWDVPGAFRGSEGTWELVYDPGTNTVVHFLFR